MTSENAKAKALLEQAGDMLSEAYGLAEDGTNKHETIGSALDDLAFVMHQMWPDENSEPWQDGTNPIDHAADCVMFCMEVKDEKDDAPSTELVEQAEAHIWTAATLLWGEQWKAAMDGRIQAKAQAMVAACNDIVAEAREVADNYARMEYAEPSRLRECWGMYMPDIDEPTGAALHLLGAMANLDYCRIATEGTATSGDIEGAMDHIESAVDILWPEKDETDEATDEEIAEAILEVAAKVGMDEAKSRAKADAPTTLEEAMDLLNEAADMANWLRTATEFMADGTEEAREAASIARERAMDVMTNTMAAYYYLNGGTFADRDHTTGGEDLSGIPYVEVGYADGSSTRITGCFGTDTMADVARLMAYRNAGEDASAQA